MALKKCLGKRSRVSLKRSHISNDQVNMIRFSRYCNSGNLLAAMGRRTGKTAMVMLYTKLAHRGTVLANCIHYRHGLLATPAYFSEVNLQ